MSQSRPISLAYLTVDGAGPVEHVEAAAAGGFDAAGLRILSPTHLARDTVVGDAALIREIKRACARTGVRLLDAEVATLTSGADRAGFVPMVETAAELGFAFIQLVSEEPDEARAADQLAVLCDLAAGAGLRVAIEFMRFRCLRTMEDAVSLLRRAGRPNAGVLIDALHLSRSGGSPAAVSLLPPELCAFVQICDAPAQAPPIHDLAREARTARLYPGDGDLWLEDLLDALPMDLPISVEVPCLAHAGRSAVERARLAGDATRRFLDGYRARRRGKVPPLQR
jgi:sugar phosphate isomerase/epimerase